MANVAIKTYRATWMPADETAHENGTNTPYDPIKTTLTHSNSTPNITHGHSDAWSNYNRLSNSTIKGVGPWAKDRSDGHIFCSWGLTGSKHSEIFRIGSDLDSRWMPYVKGVGFKVFRHRTDSTSFTNDNANQHCIFVQRFGMKFKHRSKDEERFYSSWELATSGEAKGYTYPYGGGVATDEFYRTTDMAFDGYRDWLLCEFWVNLASRDTKKVGTASTNVYIYDLQFYYDSQAGTNQLVEPAFRRDSDRNDAMFGG